MRKFTMFVALFFSMFTMVPKVSALVKFDTKGAPITSLSSLKEGSQVVFYNTGRSAYLMESSTNGMYLTTAEPEAQTTPVCSMYLRYNS